jgi:hypothetical protein
MYSEIKKSLLSTGKYNQLLSIATTLESLKKDDEKVEFILCQLQTAKDAGHIEGMKDAMKNIITSISTSIETSMKESLDIEESINEHRNSIV